MLDIVNTIFNADEKAVKNNISNEMDNNRSMLEIIEAEKEMEIMVRSYEVVDRYTDIILSGDEKQIKAVSEVLGVNIVEGYEGTDLKDKLKMMWEKVKNFIKQMIIKFKKYLAVVITWIRKTLKLTTYDYLVRTKEKINGKKLEESKLPEESEKKLKKMMSCVIYFYNKIDGNTVDGFVKDYLIKYLNASVGLIKKSTDKLQNNPTEPGISKSDMDSGNFIKDNKMVKENEDNSKCKSGTVDAVSFNKILVSDVDDTNIENPKIVVRTCSFVYGTNKSITIEPIDPNSLDKLINRFKEGMKVADKFLKEVDSTTKKLFDTVEELDEKATKTNDKIGKVIIETVKDSIRSVIEILVFYIGVARTLYKSPEVEYYVSESVKLYK